MLALLVSAKSDRLLIDRAVAGDEKAYSLLYNTYYRRLKMFVKGFIRDTNNIDDVVQETFAQAFRYLPHFRGDSAFFTWLCTIAKNTIYKMKPQAQKVSDNVISEDTPEKHIMNFEMLTEWLEDMSEIQRMAVNLHYIHGLTAKEITSIIPMKRRAISTMLWRAKQKLKGMLYDE